MAISSSFRRLSNTFEHFLRLLLSITFNHFRTLSSIGYHFRWISNQMIWQVHTKTFFRSGKPKSHPQKKILYNKTKRNVIKSWIQERTMLAKPKKRKFTVESKKKMFLLCLKHSFSIRYQKIENLSIFFFIKKNGTDSGLYEVYTGVGDIKKLGVIKRWQRKSSTKFWPNASDGRTSVCNMINGTDSSQYEPLIDNPSDVVMHIFINDICRSV